MNKSLISLILLAAALPLGCKGEEEEPDPLATRAGFCDAWAEAACSQAVIDACNVAEVADCRSTQSVYCLSLLPRQYQSSDQAEACVTAVGSAYADGDLTADELAIVTRLGAPCDRLSTGTSDDGESCEANDDCNTARGSTCIKKLGAAEGTCGVPEEVAAGDACDAPTQVCKAGYYCNAENCVTYKKTGVACTGDYMCKPEDHCVIEAPATEGTCEPRADLSDACISDDDCQSHYCAIAQDATEGKCASKLRLGINEPLCDNLR